MRRRRSGWRTVRLTHQEIVGIDQTPIQRREKGIPKRALAGRRSRQPTAIIGDGADSLGALGHAVADEDMAFMMAPGRKHGGIKNKPDGLAQPRQDRLRTQGQLLVADQVQRQSGGAQSLFRQSVAFAPFEGVRQRVSTHFANAGIRPRPDVADQENQVHIASVGDLGDIGHVALRRIHDDAAVRMAGGDPAAQDIELLAQGPVVVLQQPLDGGAPDSALREQPAAGAAARGALRPAQENGRFGRSAALAQDTDPLAHPDNFGMTAEHEIQKGRAAVAKAADEDKGLAFHEHADHPAKKRRRRDVQKSSAPTGAASAARRSTRYS
jgi:hypothetical protein